MNPNASKQGKLLHTPRPATGVSRVQSVPRAVPEVSPRKRGRPRECPTGCLWGASHPGLRSVQKASRECAQGVKRCPGHSGDTLGRLSQHFSDTPEPRAPETPREILSRTPPFSGTHFGPEGESPVAGWGARKQTRRF